MISVVMASYLGDYKGAAKDRDKKIVRAIQSILDQTVKTEPVVIADGCHKTTEIIKKQFFGKVNGYYIAKQPKWYGAPRNTGIKVAQNDVICYLDVDDWLEKWHCEFIMDHFMGSDWVWFNDIVFSRALGKWKKRVCDVDKMGFCGTSNIAHRKIATWPVRGTYAHDWVFVKNLKNASAKYKFIGDGGYRVGHIPGRYDI